MLGIYCRISKRKEEGKDVSIQTQTEAGIKFASENNLPYEVFVDKGISGAKRDIEARPRFYDMFKAIEKKKVTAVYCYDQSRIERNTEVWLLFAGTMLQYECKYYPNGVYTDLDEPLNRMVTGMLSLMNALYAAQTGKKVRENILKNARAGKAHGITAYGYEKDNEGFLRVNGKEAKIVERIFQLSLAGNGTYSIAKTLNGEAIPTKFNRWDGVIKRKDDYTGEEHEYRSKEVRWRGNVIHDMLRNPIYKGLRKWKDEEIKVPPLIDEKTWDRANRNLQANKKNVGKRAEYQYLLNGIIYCGNCGGEMRGKRRLKGNDNAYKCKHRVSSTLSCPHSRAISIPKLEAFVFRWIFNRDLHRKFLSSLPNKTKEQDSILKTKLKNYQSQLDKTEMRIRNATELLLEDEFKGDLTIRTKIGAEKKRKMDLEQTIETLQLQIAERRNGDIKEVSNRLIKHYSLSTNFDNVKTVIHSLIDRVTVHHTKGKTGGKFKISMEWKGINRTLNFQTDWQCWNYRWLETKSTVFIDEQEYLHFQ